jgi:hypothetical protein
MNLVVSGWRSPLATDLPTRKQTCAEAILEKITLVISLAVYGGSGNFNLSG